MVDTSVGREAKPRANGPLTTLRTVACVVIAAIAAATVAAVLLDVAGPSSPIRDSTAPLVTHEPIPVEPYNPREVGELATRSEAPSGYFALEIDVLDDRLEPLEGARLRAVSRACRVLTPGLVLADCVADESGRAYLSSARPPRFIHCQAVGFGVEVVEAPEQSGSRVQLVMRRESQLQVNVAFESGDPLAGCIITVCREALGAMPTVDAAAVSGCPSSWSTLNGVTDELGQVVFDGLGSQGVYIYASAPDAVVCAGVRVDLRSGSRSKLDLRAIEVVGALLPLSVNDDVLRVLSISPAGLAPLPIGAYPAAMGELRRRIAREHDVPVHDVFLFAHRGRMGNAISTDIEYESATRGVQRCSLAFRPISQIAGYSELPLPVGELRDDAVVATLDIDAPAPVIAGLENGKLTLVRFGSGPSDPGYVIGIRPGISKLVPAGVYTLCCAEPEVFKLNGHKGATVWNINKDNPTMKLDLKRELVRVCVEARLDGELYMGPLGLEFATGEYGMQYFLSDGRTEPFCTWVPRSGLETASWRGSIGTVVANTTGATPMEGNPGGYEVVINFRP